MSKKTSAKANGFGKALTLGALSVGASMLPIAHAYALDDNALPSGGTVVGGSASIEYTTPGQLDIHQSSNVAVINWNSFNIGKNATTQFYQPGSSSIAVNKVVGDNQDPTQILGTLKANGTVFVLDKNGVVFGKDSTVDVGAIVVSTGDIDNNAIMNGDTHIQITGADTGGAIVNDGKITVSEAGLAAFVAPTVVNNGVIQAKMGRVALASGNTATVDLYGDGLVEVAASDPATNAAINNTGTIAAEGGTVLMTASAAKGLVNSVINTSGIVTTASATVKGGKIVIEGANATVSGTLDASGKTGGGSIQVGGGYQGQGATKHADYTTVTKDAVIKANATESGDGGEVVIWSDVQTDVAGTIQARGAASGKGGLVETSSKKLMHIDVDTAVNVGADSGIGGEWLLDPEDIYISDAMGGDGNAATTDVNTSTINSALNAGGNVTIATSGAASGSGDITIATSSTINKSTANNSATLTFKAHRNIIVGSASITSTSNDALNVVFNADSDGDHSGHILASGATINTSGGYLVMGGGSGTLGGVDGILGNGDGTGADDMAAWGTSSSNRYGIYVFGGTYTTGSGRIIISGHGYNGDSTLSDIYGIYLSGGANFQTTTGNIDIKGTGGAGEDRNHGVAIMYTSTTVQSAKGTINITGTGGGTNTSGSNDTAGFFIGNTAQVLSTGTGSDAATINITGTSTTGDLGKIGIYITGGIVSSIKGDITLIATGGTTNYSYGILMSGASVTSTGSAKITATGNGLTDFYIYNPTASTIGGASATGDITLNGNTFNMDSGTTPTIRTSGTIYVTPRTASTTIGLGGGTGTLNLSDTELSAFTAGTLVIGNSTSGTGDIAVDTWDLSAKTHNVELYGNDIDISGLTLGTGSFKAVGKDNGSDYGTVNVSAAITKSVTGTSTLNLWSDQNVTIGSTITATNGTLNILLNADRDSNQAGRVVINGGAITTNNGYFVAGGGSGTLGGVDGILGNGDGTGADDVAAYASTGETNGIQVSASSHISTGTGDIILTGVGGTGVGQSGIYISTNLTTTTGHIKIKGTGGTGTNTGSSGVYITGSTIQSDSGNIDIYGYAKGTGDTSNIERTSNLLNATIRTTTNTDGLGNISIYGDASQSTAAFKRSFEAARSTIQTQAGDITIAATGASTYGSLIFYQDNTIASQNGGDIHINSLTGTVTLDASSAAQGTTIGHANTNLVEIIGDNLSITSPASTVKTNILGNTVLIKPYTASATIGLGGGSGTLNISDFELGFFNPTNKLIIGDSVAGIGDIDLDSWDLSTKTYNVEVYGNDIDVGGLTLGTGSFMAHAMDNGTTDLGVLTFSAATTKSLSGTSSLTLRADRDIIFSSGANITATNGSLNVILNADRDADQDGAINITSSAITTNGGYAVLGGGSGTLGGVDGILGNGDGTGADDVAAWGNASYFRGVNLDNGDISTGAGAIIINGHGGNNAASSTNVGVRVMNGSVLQTTSGAVSLYGTGGTGTDTNIGTQLRDNGTAIQTQTGAITLTGYGGVGSATSNQGIGVIDGASIYSTDLNAGDIRLNGYGGASNSQYNYGVRISGNATYTTYVTSATGDVYINGTGGGSGGGASNNQGILLGQGKTEISSTGTTADAANISVNGIAGGGTGSNGIYLDANSGTASVKTTAGDILMTGTSPLSSGIAIINGSNLYAIQSLGSGDIELNASSITFSGTNTYVGGTAMTGILSIIGDTLGLDTGRFNTAASSSIIVKSKTSQTMGLGGGTGTFNLNDTELSNFGTTGTLIIGDSTGAIKGDIDLDSWDLSGKTYNVEIYGNDIDVGGLTLGTGNFMAHAMDIGSTDLADLTVSAAITKSLAGASNLTLRADHGIIGNADITATTGSLNTILNADRNANQDGNINLSYGISTNGGNITLGGGSGTIGVESGYAFGASGGTHGVYVGGALQAGGGNIIINGKGNITGSTTSITGVYVNANIATTGTGTISISGYGGNSAVASSNSHGVRLASGSTVSTGTGALTIKGYGGNSAIVGDSDYGIYMSAGNIQSSGGLITLTGYGSTGGGASPYGLFISGGNITNTTGNIIIYGEAGATGSSRTGFRMSGGTINSGSGTTTLTGVGSTDFNMSGGNIGTGATTGSITVNADTINNTGTTFTTSGILTIKPRTTSTAIGLGGGTGTLNLDDSELAYFNAGTLIIGDSTGTIIGDIDLDSWDLSGKTYNVEVYGNDIDIGGLTLGTGSFMAHAMDIGTTDLGTLTVSAATTKSLGGASSLTLRADKDIVFSSGANVTANNGSLNVVLNADRDADHDGAISITTSAITTNGGYAVLGGGSGTLGGVDGILGNGDGTGADDTAAWGNATYKYGVDLNNGDIDTASGLILINGHGSTDSSATVNRHGVNLQNGSVVSTTSGNIVFKGTGGGSASSSYDHGISIAGSTSEVITQTGEIRLIGTGGSGNNDAVGVLVIGGKVTSSNTGKIYISGTGGTAGVGNTGVVINSNGSITAKDGDIEIIGTGPSADIFSRGIMINNNGSISSTGLGKIYLTGDAYLDFFLYDGGGALTKSIGTSQTISDIYLTGNTFDIQNGTSIQTAGTIYVAPRTASTTIGLGGGTGTLNLDDNELSYFNAGTLVIGNSTSGTGDIDLDSWDLSSKTHNVEIYGNDIDIGGVTLGTGDFMAHAMDDGATDLANLTVSSAVTKSLTGSSTLTLRSDQDILVNAAITATTGSLETILNSDRDGDLDGNVNVNAAITTNGGDITIGGGSGTISAESGYAVGNNNVNSKYGVYLSGSLQAGGGDIVINGQGNPNGTATNNIGVYIASSVSTTGTGTIFISGIGGNIGGTNSSNIGIQTAGGTISTGTGAITLKGQGGNDTLAGEGDYGMLLSSNIQSSGGLITLEGYGSESGGSNLYGVFITGGNITNTTGNIDVYGQAGATGSALTGLRMSGGTIDSGSGTTTLTGVSVAGTDISMSGGSVGTGTTSGNIIVNADEIDNSGTLFRTLGTVTIKPRTASTSIGLGSGSGALSLTNTELGYITAGTLVIGDNIAGTGDVDIDTINLSAKSYNLQIFGKDMDIGGLTLGSGDVFLYGKGNMTVSADSISNSAGDLNLLATGDVTVNHALANSGAGAINIFSGWDGASGITTPALYNRENVDLGLTARDITLGTNGRIASGGSGTSVLLVASDDFINNSTVGVNAVDAGPGRYLIYSSDPAETNKGDLTGKSLYNATYDSNAPSSITATGNRFVYAYQPTLTIRADDTTSLIDLSDLVYSYTATGEINGDILADILSGTPNYSLTPINSNTQQINIGAGSLISAAGYNLVFVNGTLTMVDAPPPPPPSTSPTGTISINIINQFTNLVPYTVIADIKSLPSGSPNEDVSDIEPEAGKSADVKDEVGCLTNTQDGSCLLH